MVVKANIVPVRIRTLMNLANGIGISTANIIVEDWNAQSSYVVGLKDADLHRVWERFLGILRELIEDFVSIVRDVGVGDVSEVLDLLADIVAYSYRFPLYGYRAHETSILPPHVGIVANKILGYVCREHVEKLDPLILYSLVYQWLIYTGRGETFDIRELCGKADEKTVRVLEKASKIMLTLIGMNRRGLELQQLLELSLYAIPADTRPGANTSSLLLHLLLSSGIALALANNLDKKFVPILRLAMLLHDIGKPIDYEKHVEASTNISRELFKPLAEISEELSKLVNIIVKLVETHHNYDLCMQQLSPLLRDKAGKLCRAATDGDRYAAGIDRVVEILTLSYKCATAPTTVATEVCNELSRFDLPKVVEEFVAIASEKLGIPKDEVIEVLYRRRGVDAKTLWSYWRRLWSEEPKLLLELSSRIASALSALDPKLVSQRKTARVHCHAKLLVIDIGGVQASIRETFKLRTLAGTSLVVDYLTYTTIPLILDRAVGVKLESIVYVGGATLHAIASKDLNRETLAKALKSMMGGLLKLVLPGVSIRIGFGDIDFESMFGYVRAVIDAYKDLDKQRLEPGKPLQLAISFTHINRYCRYCFTRPAHLALHGEPVCIVCFTRYLLSYPLGYGYRLNNVRNYVASLKISQRVQEILNSILEDPLKALAYPARDCIAVIKADGNLMTSFMYLSISPSAYFEKSIRIDLALRKAISTYMDFLKNSLSIIGSETLPENRVINIVLLCLTPVTLGLLYGGGDDLMMIVPVSIAIPTALTIAYIFASELGFRCSLSIGVAAGPRHQPIWWLVDVSNELLSKAKKILREVVVQAYRSGSKIFEIGALSYDYSRRALSLQKTILRLGERLGPITVVSRNGIDMQSIASALLNIDLSEALKNCINSSRADEEVEELLKQMVRTVVEDGRAEEVIKTLNRYLSMAQRVEMLPYVLVSDEDARKALGKAYDLVIETASRDLGLLPKLLYELYLASKLMGG